MSAAAAFWLIVITHCAPAGADGLRVCRQWIVAAEPFTSAAACEAARAELPVPSGVPGTVQTDCVKLEAEGTAL